MAVDTSVTDSNSGFEVNTAMVPRSSLSFSFLKSFRVTVQLFIKISSGFKTPSLKESDFGFDGGKQVIATKGNSETHITVIINDKLNRLHCGIYSDIIV